MPETLNTSRQRVTMQDAQESLEREIANPRMKRTDIALTYAFGIRDCAAEVDWATVNQQIIDRWSVSGLQYIKRQAWKQLLELVEGA